MAEQQNCFLNAVRCEHTDVLGSGTAKNDIVSGWIIWPFNKAGGFTEIIQHWWNYDPIAKVHFDTTAEDKSLEAIDREYVADHDIKNESQRLLDNIVSNVGHDLIYEDKQWFQIIETTPNNFSKVEISDLRTENILILNK